MSSDQRTVGVPTAGSVAWALDLAERPEAGGGPSVGDRPEVDAAYVGYGLGGRDRVSDPSGDCYDRDSL